VICIHQSGFSRCGTLTKIVFVADSQIRTIAGFIGCVSLKEIPIPESVENISGFHKCASGSVLRFGGNSHLIEIHGFSNCTAFRQFELPAFLHRIKADGFSKCSS
jgi:hypothetical protein